MGVIEMPSNFNELIEKFDALALRLRIMFTVSVVAILMLIFDMMWFAPNQQTVERTKKAIETTTSQQAEMVEMQRAYNQTVLNKRNDPKHQKLLLIESQLSDVRQQLTDKTVNLVKPEDMAKVIKAIIQSTNSLEIQSLSKMATLEISSEADANSSPEEVSDQDDNQIKLYRHTMKIVLQGKYSSTHQFLEALENMKKKVGFDHFEYVVNDYPDADIVLTVSTLSLNRGWIGG
jgi:MSHA biogenesis protein MshJ